MEQAKLLKRARRAGAIGLIVAALGGAAFSLVRSQAANDLEDRHYGDKQASDTGPRIQRECADTRGPAFAKCQDEIVDARDQRDRVQDDLSTQRKIANGTTWFFGAGLVELAGDYPLAPSTARAKAIGTGWRFNRNTRDRGWCSAQSRRFARCTSVEIRTRVYRAFSAACRSSK